MNLWGVSAMLYNRPKNVLPRQNVAQLLKPASANAEENMSCVHVDYKLHFMQPHFY